MKTRPQPQTGTLRSSLLVSLASLCAALILAELSLRLIHSGEKPQQAPRLKERPAMFFMPPGSPSTQDGAYTLRKAPHSFRVAVVGDSFTFAPRMQYDDSYPKRLERFLNLNATQQTAEVINFGAPGAGTTQEVALVGEALRYSPDLVVLEITLNDAQLRPLNLESEDVQRKFGRLPLDVEGSFWLRNSRLLRLVAERIHNQRTVANYIQYHYDLFSNPESGGAFRKALDSIKGLFQNGGNSPRLVAMVFPLFDFPLDDHYPFAKLHQSIVEELKSRGIPALDLFKAFEGIPVTRLQLIPGHDSHPNEIAHRIAAERLLSWLVKHDAIPPSLVPARVYRERSNIKEPQLQAPFSLKARKGDLSSHKNPAK